MPGRGLAEARILSKKALEISPPRVYTLPCAPGAGSGGVYLRKEVDAMNRDMTIDMCSGPLPGKLLRFSLPIMLSGILQLLFNAADIIVVGQFTGSAAMAAVGSTGPLNNLIINVFLGLSSGASVVMAQYYGMRSWKDAGEVVHTSILLGAISGCALVFIGIALARPMLTAMGTTSDVIDQSVLYMRIVFAGMPAIMIYDFGAGILRAVGDTRRPLLYLLCGGIANVFLNLFFVIVCNLGVAGVAIGTVASQSIAGFLTIRCLARSDAPYGLRRGELRIAKKKLLRILRVGIPTGISGAMFSISNVIIQSSINSFNSSAIVAANTAAGNIEGFVYTGMNALYQAALTFTGQNAGARRTERIAPILGWCLLFVTVLGLAVGGLAALLGRQLLSIYNSDATVISYGLERLRLMALTYFICGAMDIATGSIRGLGPSITPTLVSLAGICGLRIVWVYTVFAARRSLMSLYVSYPVSWAVTLAVHLVCFAVFFRRWKKRVQG